MKKIITTVLLFFSLVCSVNAVADTECDKKCCKNSDQTDCNEKDSFQNFGIFEINDEIFSRIKGKSYKDNCTVPLDELRFIQILHYDLNGDIHTGELICNREIADDLIDIFKNLYKIKYPIERMVLIDEYDADDIKSMQANNSSCFNYRVIEGTTKLSNHALGNAVDINPLYNPFVLKRDNGTYFISPEEGAPYVDRTQAFPYKIDEEDPCYLEFKKHGFEWGGDWTSRKDYQHFEKNINK